VSRPLDPRLLHALPVVRRLLRTLCCLQVLGALLTVAQAALLADLVVAVVLQGQHGGPLAPRLVLLVAAMGGRAGVAAAQEWVAARASSQTRPDLRRAVLTAVTRLGPTWAGRQPAGRLVTAAGPGLEAMDGYLTLAVPALTAAAVVPVVVLATIAVTDWQSALVLVVTLPLVPLFMVLVGATTRRRMQAQYETLARLAGHFLDLVQGLTTLKVYGQAHRQVEAVRRATDAYRVQTMQTLRVALLSGLVLDLLATLSVAVVAVDVGLRLDAGHLTLRPALLVLLLAPELFAPLRAMGAQHHDSEQGRVASAMALDVLDQARALPVAEQLRCSRPAGMVRVRALHVAHAGRSHPALDGVDLDISPGTVVVLQGPSGGGKSTLLAVLLGLVEPTSGSILVGDKDLRELDPALWRAGTAWAPQRPHTTQPTVAEEVLLGDPAATRPQLLAALTDCRALSPETRLGEDGTHISTGQRRRVAVARALLRARAVRAAGGVPLVLLDEPSEDLDLDTERVVAAVISRLAGWATVLVATHSPRLAGLGDRRVELRDGQVVSDVAQCRETQGPEMQGPEMQGPEMQGPEMQGREIAGPGPARVPGPRLQAPAPVPPAARPLRDLVSALAAERPPGTGRRLVGAGLLAGGVGLSGLALLTTSVWLISRAAQHPEVQALALAVVGVRGFALARALLRYVERLVSHDAALHLLADVRTRVFAALHPLAPAGLAELRRGDLLRRFVSDVDGAQDALVRTAVPVMGAMIAALGAVTVAALLSPSSGAVLAMGLLVALVCVPVLSQHLARGAAVRAQAAGLRDARTSALLDGLAELTAYGAESAAVAEVAQADAVLLQLARRPARSAAAGAALSGLVAAVTLALVLATAATAAADGSVAPITVGVLAACVLAGFDALAPLPAALAAWAGVRAGLDRVVGLLSTPLPVPEPEQPLRAPEGRLGVQVAAVTLAPSATAPAVLTAASLSLLPGQRIAVTGPSGCGKSTLLTAVLRLLPVRAGSISIVAGGEALPVSSIPAADIPPLVAGSLQGDHVFHASLRDNLRVVRPKATDDELDAVAARAGLREFVRELPDGWSSSAGADGAHLSGGQRQRLLLARALLADPVVLVLDEPTAHLDPATERAVLADLLAGTRGQTVLMSTHRQLAEDEADQVVRVLDDELVPMSARPTASAGPAAQLSGRG